MTASAEGYGDDFRVVRRADGQLLDYPVKLRWELTRRHPYYLDVWEEVRRYHSDPPGDDPARRSRGYLSKMILGYIGVHGRPVAPTTSFEELCGPDCDPAFLCGSLQPVTFRALAVLFLRQFPPHARAVLGSMLSASSANELDDALSSDERAFAEVQIFAELQALGHPSLDLVPSGPIFFMHLGASQSSIVDDATDQARRWKKRAKAAPKKIHTKKVAEQLAVWDLFEGWNGGGYDPAHPVRLDEIALRLAQPKSTIYSRYVAAFECVLGQPFQPALWWATMGAFKLWQLKSNPADYGRVARQRRMANRTRKPVPETKLLGNRGSRNGDGGRGESHPGMRDDFLTGSIAAPGDESTYQLTEDIQSLIAKGSDDAAVASELGLSDTTLVEYFRRQDGVLQELLAHLPEPA